MGVGLSGTLNTHESTKEKVILMMSKVDAIEWQPTSLEEATLYSPGHFLIGKKKAGWSGGQPNLHIMTSVLPPGIFGLSLLLPVCPVIPSFAHFDSCCFTRNFKSDATHISPGCPIWCQHGAFSGVGAIVASFVPAECPEGGGMWGIFGKPLKRAIWNTRVCMLC